MKNIDLLYDIEIKRPNGTIRKKTKPRRCHSFVRQFPDFLLKVFRLGYFDYGGSNVGNTQVIKDIYGISRSGLYNNFVANGSSGDTSCGTVVGTGISSAYITPDGNNVSYMSGNTTGPLVVSASVENPPYYAFQAFDGSASTWWTDYSYSGLPQWLKIDIGSGNESIATSYNVVASTYYSGAGSAPRDWTLQGSNTGAFSGEQATLDTVTNQTGWSDLESRSFTCDVATTAYRYFRIYISNNNGGQYVALGSLIIFRVPGVSIIPVTVNDYRLVNRIGHGTSSGQLQYAPESFGIPVLDLATSSSYFVTSRLFTNNSGGNVTINEIGLYLKGVGYNLYSYMIIRDIVDPINLAIGESVTVNHTMRMTA